MVNFGGFSWIFRFLDLAVLDFPGFPLFPGFYCFWVLLLSEFCFLDFKFLGFTSFGFVRVWILFEFGVWFLGGWVLDLVWARVWIDFALWFLFLFYFALVLLAFARGFLVDDCLCWWCIAEWFCFFGLAGCLVYLCWVVVA